LYTNIARGKFAPPTITSVKHLLPPHQDRDLVAISPTGTGKTLAYLLPIFAKLLVPATNSSVDAGIGVRALVVVPTRELAHQIHNECLKLAQGRKWKIVLFNKATANALSQKEARDKVGKVVLKILCCSGKKKMMIVQI
jgi:ATP-dependent RNA helicase DDX52/ROK1